MKHLLLVGAQKSGTTYLHNLLAQDPAIAVHRRKEPKYFAKPRFEGTDYLAMFEGVAAAEAVLDSSAAYLHVAGTATRAARHLGPEAVVVAVLRDPVERAVSAYLHSVKHGRDLRSAEEALALDAITADDVAAEETEKIDRALRRGLVPRPAPDDAYHDPVFHYRYVTNSLYGRQLLPWSDAFAELLVFDFTDLAARPGAIADTVRGRVGLTAPLSYRLEVGRNATKLDRWTSLRKSRFDGAIPLPAALWRLLTQRYDADLLERICTAKWTGAARADHRALTERGSSGPVTLSPPVASTG